MPGGREPDDLEGDAQIQLSLWHRLLLSLPRLRHDANEEPLGERLRRAIVKPPPPGEAPVSKAPEKPMSVEELEAADRAANDKERLIGLLAAPVSAAIGLLVTNDLIAHDPSGRRHVPVSDYHELIIVFLALSVVMLAAAWFRKRLYLGMVIALYGLAIFNLKYWGFGIPFVMVGAWLLVRAYRLHRDLRDATGSGPSRLGSRGQVRGATNSARPQPNKRYTPPPPPPSKRSSSSRRTSSPKAENKQQRAG